MPRVAGALGLCLGLLLGVRPASLADQASDPASAAAQERAVKMQRFIVSAARVDKNPWRYASLPGFEILTRASPEKTASMLDSLRRGLWLQNDLMTKEWLPQSPVPYTVIIDDTDLATISVSQLHFQTINLQAPADAVAWGKLSGGALIWTDRLPACDSDTLAFNTNVFGVDMNTMAYGSISLDRLGHCAPPIPRWLVAGLVGPTSGIFREGFEPVVRRGLFGAGWIHNAIGPGTLWFSLEETQRLMDQIAQNKAHDKATPIVVPPLQNLFREATPPPEDLPIWESEAALLARWGLMGPGSEDPATSRGFLELVRRARTEPISEHVFKECLGFGYDEMEKRLGYFLTAVLGRPTSLELDMPAEYPKPALKTATAGQVGRILGDWLRMQGDSYRRSDPSLSRESFYFAGRVLERALRSGSWPPGGRSEVPVAPPPGDPDSQESVLASADRVSDPELLAVYGLFAHDTGNTGVSREFLEAAMKAKAVRPRAQIVLAQQRYSEAIGKPQGSGGKLSAQQASSVLVPVMAALQKAPSEEAYSLIVETWSRCDTRPGESDVDEIIKGAGLYPRNTDLAYDSALLCSLSGYDAQAAKLIDLGLVFTTHEVNRQHFLELRSNLAAPQAGDRSRPKDAVLLPAMFVYGLRPPPVYGHALLRGWEPPDYPKDALKEWLGGSVDLRLVINERGGVVSSRVLSATDPRFIKAAQDAVKRWTFSPALSANVPIACSMDTSVVFSPDNPTSRRMGGSFLPPEAELPVPAPTTEATLASTPDIDYPHVLFDRKLSGRAHYLCTVLPNGHVADPRIIAASNVEFILPALKAIGNLQYNPRMQGDQPIESEVEGDLRFDLTLGGAVGALAANRITAPDGSQPAASLEPLALVDPIYPFDLLLKGEEGSATVAFTVGTNGSPSDVHVIAASNPDFGEALSAAVELSAFSPPALNGRSASVALIRKAEFSPVPSGPDSGSDPAAQLQAALRTGRVGNGTDLDERPVPRYQVSPRYPEFLMNGARPAGQAVVEFVIDRDGRARFPQIVSCSEPEFGWAAATAVSQWVFDPPRCNGRPSAVRARIPFKFKAPT